MADQRRWFKVWTSIVANARFAEMSLEDIGRWTLLGAATALDGDSGRLEVPGSGRELCRLLRVDAIDDAREALKRIPSVVFEEGKNRYGEWAVTWRNWRKYQEDSTAANRMRTLRSKRRREEKRREDPPIAPPSGVPRGTLWDAVTDVLAYLNRKTGRTFVAMTARGKPTASAEFVRARLADGATAETCRAVIDRKAAEWGNDPRMRQYLRPETLFNRTKFEGYAAEVNGQPPEDDEE